MDDVLRRLGEKNKLLLCSLFNTAYCVLQSEMPFTVYPTLLKLQVKMALICQKLRAIKATRDVLDLPLILLKALEMISWNPFVMLEHYLSCTTEQLTAVVEIVNCRVLKNGEPKKFLITLEDLEHAHGQGVFNAIDRAMQKYGYMKEKLIGAGCDGASVNLGVNESVATRLREKRPNVMTVHCVAHRLERLIVFNASTLPRIHLNSFIPSEISRSKTLR